MEYAYQYVDSLILCMIVLCMCVWIYKEMVTLKDRLRFYDPEEYYRWDRTSNYDKDDVYDKIVKERL